VAKDSEETRARAEARFQQAQKRAQDTDDAVAESKAQARAVDEKTVRLRSLRLAKEAADRETDADKKSAPRKKRPT
jgi:hypothetical protein